MLHNLQVPWFAPLALVMAVWGFRTARTSGLGVAEQWQVRLLGFSPFAFWLLFQFTTSFGSRP